MLNSMYGKAIKTNFTMAKKPIKWAKVERKDLTSPNLKNSED